MTPEQVEKIFLPFEQVGDTQKQSEGTAPNSGGADPRNQRQSPPELGDLGGRRVKNEDDETCVYTAAFPRGI